MLSNILLYSDMTLVLKFYFEAALLASEKLIEGWRCSSAVERLASVYGPWGQSIASHKQARQQTNTKQTPATQPNRQHRGKTGK